MNTVKLKIICPTKNISSQQYAGLLFLGYSGQFEILPNHENLISLIKPSSIVDVTKSKVVSIVSSAVLQFTNQFNICEVSVENCFMHYEFSGVKKQDLDKKINAAHSQNTKDFYNLVMDELDLRKSIA